MQLADRVIVLLSGGQDSTTALYWAKQHFASVWALSIRYGQRHEREIASAAEIAIMADAKHYIAEIQLGSAFSMSALTSTHGDLTADGGPGGLPSSFVPGRNLFFFALAALYAYECSTSHIVSGVCETDFSGYPDCRRTFVDSFCETWRRATSWPIEIHTPLMYLSKAETVKLAHRFPGCWDALRRTVTCYEGKRPGCGECPSCKLRAKGFEEAGERDPALDARV